MTRSVTSTVENAITSGAAYKLHTRLKVEPSYMYYGSFDSNNAPGIADAQGMLEDPIPQDITFTTGSSPKVVTFYNDGGDLKYQLETSGSLITVTGGAMTGKPGAYGGYLFFVNDSSQLVRKTLNFSAIESLSADIFSASATLASGVLDDTVVHGVADDACVLFSSGSGGIRVSLVIDDGGWQEYQQDHRFMFPLAYDYTGGSSPRTFSSFAAYSGAAKLGNDVFAYISNAITGGVDAIYWNADSTSWSDIYTAVAADLKASICEFRIANCYVYDSVIYMAGQFRRNENVDSELTYGMILRSDNGKVFAMDAFSLVSDLDYRLLAGFSDDDLVISSCNRVARDPATWIFGGDTLYLDIDESDIQSVSDEALTRLQITPAAGDEALLYHAYMKPGSKVTLEIGYSTTSGSEFVVFGTYMVDAIKGGVKDGARLLSFQATNVAQWQLEGMSSPFYTEIISKSSARDDLTSAETTQLYVAEFAGLWEYEVSVDFWESEQYTDDDLSITSLDIFTKGGVDRIECSGNHKIGVRTKDLKYAISCEEYPTFTSGSATFEIYGWSYADSGNDNDEVQLVLWLEDTSGSLYEHFETGERWPCTYPSSASGDEPITYIVQKPIGTKVRRMGLVFVNSSTTYSYPVRIDITDGIECYYGAMDSNTGWYSTVDKEWKVRGKNRPYIMFSRQPYDTFNFMVASEFEDDLTGYVMTLGPVAYGLVGLAQNGKNYIVGRYNKVTEKLEIVKVRSGQETLLADVSPTVGVSGGCKMMFSHKDGTFEIRLENSSGVWVSELTYEWTDSDEWMFTDEIAAKHTGIYGYIKVPAFRITGLDEGADPDLDRALGVGVLPGEHYLSYFPSSGKVDIGDRVYTYSGIIALPTYIRGPFQYRHHGEDPPPYGQGGFALECRDHDWSMPQNSFTGKLMGVDDGVVYKVLGSDWQLWDRTSGVVRQLPGRARFYAQEAIFRAVYHTLNNRVYITGGLNDIALAKGEATYEPWGDTCYLHTDGDITLKWFYGSSGDFDATIEDLIEHIARSSGAGVQFPGDITSGSVSPTPSTPEEIGTIPYTDGFDILFDADELTGTNWLAVETDANMSEVEGFEGDTGVRVALERESADQYLLKCVSLTSGSFFEQYRISIIDAPHSYRVLFHSNFITVYIDGAWAFTFHTEGIVYPTTTTISLNTNQSSFTFSDIRIPELCDWREAIYIDLETDGQAAIASVIQERPVDVYARWDGTLAFWYDPTRQTVTQEIEPREHTWTEKIPRKAASDAIIYYSEVKTVLYNDYRDNFGFATKVYRMPNLDTGAIRAAKLYLAGLYLEKKVHRVVVRPDVRLELGDKLSVSYTSTGTGTVNSQIFIVDSMRMQMDPRNSTMVIEGREV